MQHLASLIFIILITVVMIQSVRVSLLKDELDAEKRWTKMRDEDVEFYTEKLARQEIQKERLIEDTLEKSKTIDSLKKQISKLKNKK